MMPDFVIIGAMKCATSTLHDQLERVAGVSMSEPKEPNFFSDEINWDRGLGWYASLFSSMPSGDLKGESSTHYSKLPTYPECAARLHAHLPDAKLIYIMRDPIDRIVSQYIHEWSQRVIDQDCLIDDAIRVHPELVAYSRYAMQLSPYIELFGQEQILPVFFERVAVEPQAEFERIGRFLGIRTPMVWATGEVQNVSADRQRRGPVLDALLGVPGFAKLRRALLPESVRSRIRSRWSIKDRPHLSDASVRWLREQLDDDMHKLGAMVGRSLDCESFKPTVMRGESPEWARIEVA